MKTVMYYLYRGILHCMTIGGALLLIILILALFLPGPRTLKNEPARTSVEQSVRAEHSTQTE